MNNRNSSENRSADESLWKPAAGIAVPVLLFAGFLSLYGGKVPGTAVAARMDTAMPLKAVAAAPEVDMGTNYYIWQIYDGEGEAEVMLMYLDTDRQPPVLREVSSSGEIYEEPEDWNIRLSSSGLNMSYHEAEDGSGSADMKKNSDGSYAGMMNLSIEEGHASIYSKLTPVIPDGNGNYTVAYSGEKLTYDEIVCDELQNKLAGIQFMIEANQQNNVISVREEEEPTPRPTIAPTTVPKADSRIPDDVMQVYITYEMENIDQEWYTRNNEGEYKVKRNHLKMPNAAEQQRFEQLIREQLAGDKLAFFYEYKDKWYK